jgi:hypothetical protein
MPYPRRGEINPGPDESPPQWSTRDPDGVASGQRRRGREARVRDGSAERRVVYEMLPRSPIQMKRNSGGGRGRVKKRGAERSGEGRGEAARV